MTEAPSVRVAAGERWHGEPPEVWRERWGVPALRIYRRVTSTNDIARELAEAGAPQGALVIADEQTRGRGRRGRVWHAAPGRSLLLSMVLRPDRTTHEALLPLRLGMAVARGIESAVDVRVGLKWPNDLYVSERKVGGLLCEGAVEGDRPLFLIAGVGLNVLQPIDELPDELADRATSLRAETGEDLAMDALAGHVVAEVLAAAGAGARPLSPAELDDLGRRDLLRGRPIDVDGRSAGVAAGIAPDGALIVEREGGTTRVRSGTVRPTDRAREHTS